LLSVYSKNLMKYIIQEISFSHKLLFLIPLSLQPDVVTFSIWNFEFY